MSYQTTVKCPVCQKTMDTLKHDEPEISGMAESLLCVDGRREHARQSPQCVGANGWHRGWDLHTVRLG